MRGPDGGVRPTIMSAARWNVTAPARLFILHGCRVHAAPATWQRHPCSRTPERAVPRGVRRLPGPVRRSGVPAGDAEPPGLPMTDVTWRDNGRVVIRDAGAAELPVLQE